MNQSFETQVRIAIRALSDVIAPALAGADKHVVEQLQLTIATLGFVADRIPEATRFARLELSSCLALAERARAIVQPSLPAESEVLAAGISVGEEVLALCVRDAADCEVASRHLREQLAALVATTHGSPCERDLTAAILDGSEAMLAQARLWALPFGFELTPEALPAPAW